jgi:hypothetical protein
MPCFIYHNIPYNTSPFGKKNPIYTLIGFKNWDFKDFILLDLHTSPVSTKFEVEFPLDDWLCFHYWC